MKELLERLRDCTGLGADFHGAEMEEAIAEIERLRGENEGHFETIIAQRDEIERLRAEIVQLKADLEWLVGLLEPLRMETMW